MAGSTGGCCRTTYTGNHGGAETPLLLVSGLPLSGGSSFSRQIRLLARGFAEAGVPAACAGMEGGRLTTAPGFGAAATDPIGSDGLLVGSARGIIALGYPDQFPFFHDGAASPPIFLWAQCSKPPDPTSLGRAKPVALTPRTAELFQRAGFDGGSRGVPIIPHAVDTEVFRPPTPEETVRPHRPPMEDGPVFGAVGANSLRKRLDLLLETFAAARRHLPSAVLVLKTDRPAADGGYDLPGLCRKHEVAAQVRLVTEELTDRDMAHLYWSMDVFLHTAEWEGFGIPVAEAMACGVPILTHDGQGPGELVPYPEWLVRDVETVQDGPVQLRWVRPLALAEAACALAEDVAQRRCMAGLGRSHAVAEYSLPAVTRRWMALVSTGT